MRKIFIFFLLWTLYISVDAQVLSEQAEVSILITSPGDEVYSAFGHAALRVYDPDKKIDYLFNYGIFSFNAPHFIYRFVKGETNYLLAVFRTSDEVTDIAIEERRLDELVLNLTQEEKQRIWMALLDNAQPEKRTYLYNFIYDNCSTRLRTILEKNVTEPIQYHRPQDGKTFRQLIHEYTPENTWKGVGNDFLIGAAADRMEEARYYSFLPDYLADELKMATRVVDGQEQPLVKQVNNMLEPGQTRKNVLIFSPFFVISLLLIMLLLLFVIRAYKNKRDRWLDILLFTTSGLAGCVLCFMNFVSVHPLVSPNYLVLFFNPLHLSVLVFAIIPRLRNYLNYFHIANVIWFVLSIFAWFFVNQCMNSVIGELALILWMRSLFLSQRSVICLLINHVTKKQ